MSIFYDTFYLHVIASIHIIISLKISLLLQFFFKEVGITGFEAVSLGFFLRGVALKFYHTGGYTDLTNSNRRLDSCS